MKTLLKLMLLAAFGIGTSAAEEPQKIQMDHNGHANIRITEAPPLTHEQLLAKLRAPVKWPDPGWTIQAARSEIAAAESVYANTGTGPKQRAWEAKHKRWLAWLGRRIASGLEGRSDDRPSITMSPLEFLALYAEPTSIWDDALANWTRRGGPGLAARAQMQAYLRGAKRIEEPTAEQSEQASEVAAMLAALNAHIAGKAKTADADALKAFVAKHTIRSEK